jgi:hypothetical protein
MGWPWGVAIATLACLARAAAAEPAPDASSGAEDHEIKLAERDQARVGDARALSLTITPRPGYSISQQGPLSVELAVEPADGVALPIQRYHRRHAADAHADAPRFDLRYRAVKPGQYALRVGLRFWVCGNATCWPLRVFRTVQLDVRSAP